MSESDLVSQIMAIYDLPEELRDWVTTPDPGEVARRKREQRYVESLPRRMREAADAVTAEYADVLPEGMRFEWRT